MTKDEMMLLTIKQLTEHFHRHPEHFELEDPEYTSEHKYTSTSTIIFQSKSDPTSSARAVMLVYNEALRTITCQIFFKCISGANTGNIKPDASATIGMKFKTFNRPYRLFRKLRNRLIERKRAEEHNEFLNKLHSVFPGTFDDYIFGKQD